ncbi:MAG: hypothetical protein OQK25_02255, partial [Gammaproteobacteria bacterium]|nr:hypothetical protein [Gammaproteobacteria bacterium]
SELFGQRAIFLTLLKVRGLDYRNDPITQHLRRIGVTAAMDRTFIVATPIITYQTAKTILDDEPNWILYQDDKQPLTLISAADLAGQTQRLRDDAQTDKIDIDEIDIVLNDVPAASRIRPLIISSRATLHDALAQLNQLKDRSVYALCIVVRGDAGSERLTGILTRRDIENYYQI